MKIKFITLLLIFSAISFAGGIETLPLAGAKTLSLNGMYFAGADGINRLLNNPAALIYMQESGVEFTVLNRLAQNRFESADRGLFKSFRNDEILIAGGIFYSAGGNLKLGLSYQPASSFNIEWPFAHYFKADTLNSLLVFDYNNRFTSEAISLGAALKLGVITIGISPVLYRVKHDLAYPLTYANWTSGTGNAAYQMSFNQEGWGFGVNAGILADLNPRMKLAMSVKSAYSADIKGTANTKYFSIGSSNPVQSDVSSTIEFPWVLGLGTVYSANEEWNFNIDAQYTLWGSLEKSIAETFANSDWQSGLSSYDELAGISGSNILLNYKNAFDVGFGIEFVSSETFSYRFGYRYSQSNNSNDTYSMLFPSVDQHWLNIGFGLSEEFLKLDGTLAYGFGISKDVDKEGNNTAGKYGYSGIIPAITLRYLIR